MHEEVHRSSQSVHTGRARADSGHDTSVVERWPAVVRGVMTVAAAVVVVAALWATAVGR